MRQSDSSKENDRFRGCLTRMWYGKCNKDDLIWLESRVAGKYNSQLDLSQPQWRYTSVINGHNEMAAIRFSRELGKPLHRFYSHDTWGSDNDPADPAENRGMKRAKTSQKQAITPDMQELLWSLTPKYTDNVPSVLDLCIGMPVMIKFNEATELCVTNGQKTCN